MNGRADDVKATDSTDDARVTNDIEGTEDADGPGSMDDIDKRAGTDGVNGAGGIGGKVGVARSDRARRRRLIVSIGIAAVLIILLIRAALPLIRFASDADALREYVDSRGVQGVLVFIGLNYLQALSTLIGAGPLEIAAGSIFGIVKGTILCDISILAGNLTAFVLSRRYGLRFISLFFSEEQVEAAREFVKGRHRDRLAALVFLMPGMPKDAAAYVLGMTDMSMVRFALTVGLCRIPGILLTVLSGDAIALGRYRNIVVIVMVTAVLYLIGALIVRAIRRRRM